jgi:hypothetical protein
MGGLSPPSGTPAPRGAPSVSSNNASACAVSESYNSRRNPARPPRPVEVSSAPAVRAWVTLGIAATAFVFELCERNPKKGSSGGRSMSRRHTGRAVGDLPLQHRQVRDQAWSTQRIAQVREVQFTPAGHASWRRPPDCSVFQRRWHRRPSANLGTLILSPTALSLVATPGSRLLIRHMVSGPAARREPAEPRQGEPLEVVRPREFRTGGGRGRVCGVAAAVFWACELRRQDAAACRRFGMCGDDERASMGDVVRFGVSGGRADMPRSGLRDLDNPGTAPGRRRPEADAALGLAPESPCTWGRSEPEDRA